MLTRADLVQDRRGPDAGYARSERGRGGTFELHSASNADRRLSRDRSARPSRPRGAPGGDEVEGARRNGTRTSSFSPCPLFPSFLLPCFSHHATTTNLALQILTSADFDEAHKGFTPLSLRDVKLEKSETAWADIGGLGDTKRILRETLEWPTKYGPIFAQSPLRLRSG